MKEFNLVLTENQLNTIDKALQALPLGEAFNVYIEIKNQITSQAVKKTSIEDIKSAS